MIKKVSFECQMWLELKIFIYTTSGKFDSSLSKSEWSADLFITLTSDTKFGVQFNLMGANGGGWRGIKKIEGGETSKDHWSVFSGSCVWHVRANNRSIAFWMSWEYEKKFF